MLFHGFIAVAPLKPQSSPVPSDVSECLFHGIIAVAPLKPRMCIRSCHSRERASSTASSPWPH